MVDDAGVATCVEAKTGKEVWKERLGGNLLRLAHLRLPGRVYFFDQDGKTTVIEAAAEYKVLAVNRLEDGLHGVARRCPATRSISARRRHSIGSKSNRPGPANH